MRLGIKEIGNLKKKKNGGKDKKVEHGPKGNIQSSLGSFFFLIFFFCKFVLKTCVSRKVSYFVNNIFQGVRNIFLLACLQILSLLNLGSRDIFKPHKNPVQIGESCYR